MGSIRASPGGSPAGMWRQASRMGRENSAASAIAAGLSELPPGGRKRVGFGKFGAMTYEDVLRQHPSYCDQVMSRADGGGMDEEFNAFAAWISRALNQKAQGAKVEARAASVSGANNKLGFGKYRELTYVETFLKDPEYCEKLMKRAAHGDMDEEFIEFGRYVYRVNEAMSGGDAAPAETPIAMGVPPAHELYPDEYSDDDEEWVEEAPALAKMRMEGGANHGEKFASVYEDDPQYCEMLVKHMLKTGSQTSKNWPLVAYVLHRQLRQVKEAGRKKR